MKILLTGGGTGGHFYPLIAIAEAINSIADKQKLLNVKLYYMSDAPYNKRALFENSITFLQVPAGKMRTYSSIKNFFDMFSTAVGAGIGLLKVFSIFPDVVISKGGYAAFPAVFAARILRIPVIVHESDSAPGRLNLWTSKFAKRIAVSYAEAGEKFPKERTAWTGQPVRKAIMQGTKEGAYEYFGLDPLTPTLLIIGGSQGAEMINNTILETLPSLIQKCQVIHQTGIKNNDDITTRANLILEKNPLKSRYKPFPYLNDLTTKMAAGVTTLVISRAGSAIFEIAGWGIPSIIIPITNSNGDHQRKNAFTYARAGGCEVIEEANLSPHVLEAEIMKLLNSPERLQQMSEHAHAFATPKAAELIAEEALRIGLSHEQ